MIIVFDNLLQTVHTLGWRGQHLVFPVLNLPFDDRGALRAAVDNLERLQTLGLRISPVFVKFECGDILVFLSWLLLVVATRSRTHTDDPQEQGRGWESQ